MSVMTDVQSVAANAKIDNVLAGKVHEFLPEDSIIRVLASADAVGVRASLLVGESVLIDDQEMSNSNRYPINPDDLLAEGAGFGADRLKLSLRNTTGAAIVVKTQVTIEPA